MAPRRKSAKRVFKLPCRIAGLLTTCAHPILTALLPPPPAHRDGVVYYKEGRRYVMDLETRDVVPG